MICTGDEIVELASFEKDKLNPIKTI